MNMSSLFKRKLIPIISFLLLFAFTPNVFADASGDGLYSSGITVEASNVYKAGAGLAEPDSLQVWLPEGELKRAILMWSGLYSGDGTHTQKPSNLIYLTDDYASYSIEGEVIAWLWDDSVTKAESFTFAADITDLGIFTPGNNNFKINCDAFDPDGAALGAGAFFFVDDGSLLPNGQKVVGNLADFLWGAEFDFKWYEENLNGNSFLYETKPYTIYFDPSEEPRLAQVPMFFTTWWGGIYEKYTITNAEFIISGPGLEDIHITEHNIIQTKDGDYADTLLVDFMIPPGYTQITAQVVSEDMGTGQANENPGIMFWHAYGVFISNGQLDDDGDQVTCSSLDWSDKLQYAYDKTNEVKKFNKRWKRNLKKLCYGQKKAPFKKFTKYYKKVLKPLLADLFGFYKDGVVCSDGTNSVGMSSATALSDRLVQASEEIQEILKYTKKARNRLKKCSANIGKKRGKKLEKKTKAVVEPLTAKFIEMTNDLNDKLNQLNQ